MFMSSKKLCSLGLVCAPLAVLACGGDDDSPGATGAVSAGGTGGGTSAGGTGGVGGTGATTSGGTGGAATGGSGGTGGRTVLDAGGRVINLTPERFFPEGVAIDKNGNFYVGSMDLGSIHRAVANDMEAEPFIEPDDTNGLVSVIGLYVDDATDTLWVCSSDAGNGSRTGMGAAALVAFQLPEGDFIASYEWPAPTSDPVPEDGNPAGVNGFCNDITIDAEGNLYATDSWYPRILRLPAGGDALQEWVVSDVFPQDQWHLNGIDVDQSNNTLYAVENHPGALYSIPIQADGSAGDVTQVTTSRDLLSPDGLKVLAPNLLVTAEGANEGGGVSVITIDGPDGEIVEVIKGFDQVATFALHQSSAWVVENQADHFWGADANGPDADPPFRLVEVPLEVGAGAGIIETTTANFFPEGVTLDDDDNFYVGSMNLGKIHRAAADGTATEDFIEPDEENGLVSVLGLHAAGSTLWVCSADAGNGELTGEAPAALKSFDIATGEMTGSWAWPEPTTDPITGDDNPADVNGFCNDIVVDADGNVYATDSWYPRILRLVADADETDELQEWVTSDVFPQDQWHLNGIDIDTATDILYAVENHPGALYAIPIEANGDAGEVTAVTTSRPLYMPDGLKVIGENLLATAEGQTGGMAVVELDGDGAGFVRRISTGFDGIATFAVRNGSAWLVENQGDHFWGGDGMETKPFRLVETPLNLE